MWHKIEKYNYAINEAGDVMALRTGNIIRPYECNGYWKVDLYINSTRRKVYVHQLVCETFHKDSFFAGAIVNHKDGDRKNNTPSNLEWTTYAQNNQHAYDFLGKICIKKKGSESHNAKQIVQLDMNGNTVFEFGSIVEAMEVYGSCVEKCLLGRNKTAYGFKWEYKNKAA